MADDRLHRLADLFAELALRWGHEIEKDSRRRDNAPFLRMALDVDRAVASGRLRDNAWDRAAEKEKLKDIRAALRKLKTSFASLHPTLRTAFEAEFEQIVSASGVDRLARCNNSDLAKGGASFEYTVFLLNAMVAEKTAMGARRGRSVVDVLLEMEPAKEVKSPPQFRKLQRNAVVQEARKIWKQITGRDAPQDIPEGGNEFGDFLSEVFIMLGSQDDVRNAVRQWKAEQKAA